MGVKGVMDKKELRRMFDSADEDGSGNMDKGEMKKLLKKKGLYPGDAFYDAVYKSIDKDGSGEIDFDEFSDGMTVIQTKKQMSDKDVREMKALFEDADDDGSGNIDKREMKKCLKKANLYPGDKEFESLYKEIDADGSGEIDFDEFTVAYAKIQSSKKGGNKGGSGELRAIFDEADEDGSGNIDKGEFKKMLKKMNLYPGDKAFDNKFKEIDSDGSGEIDFDEFTAAVKGLQEEEELKRKFKKLDSDGSGALDFKDIKLAFKAMNYPISDQAIRDMIAVASADGDDEVSFEEFCAVARRKR